ncbi:DUF368 domain-containing protein [Halobacteria archaeon AArc-m2/3/4]|uniref:DUF368 domain-containing protein n=1 Tax=Natronoglomus mannanivorans TaxID=2979990 RepID=A0ABT2QA05_9EURY|nr:DUF368 domain-containing protein [Halobacteria archaeon AArc-m2/3/4]
MGTADAVPGVSGGTVALLLGFYERLVTAIAAITPGRVRTICRGYDPESRSEARGAVDEMDLAFLVPLGLGMVSAVVLVAGAVTALSDSHPVALFGFFVGLIAVSAIVLGRELEFSGPRSIAAGVGGAVLAFGLAGGLTVLDGTGLAVIAFVGAVSMSAMILPGLSGSLLLLLFGQYVYLSGQLTAFVSAIVDVLRGGSLEAVVDPGTTVVVFVFGGFVGVLTIARVVRLALERARAVTLAFLVGLIAGSVRAPVVEAGAHVDGWTAATVGPLLGWAVIGGALVFAVDRLVGGFSPE